MLTAADSDELGIEMDDSGAVTIRDLTVTGGRDGINADDVDELTLVHVHAVGNGDEGAALEEVGTVLVVGGRSIDRGRDQESITMAAVAENGRGRG